jgi:hypothetical protein
MLRNECPGDRQRGCRCGLLSIAGRRHVQRPESWWPRDGSGRRGHIISTIDLPTPRVPWHGRHHRGRNPPGQPAAEEAERDAACEIGRDADWGRLTARAYSVQHLLALPARPLLRCAHSAASVLDGVAQDRRGGAVAGDVFAAHSENAPARDQHAPRDLVHDAVVHCVVGVVKGQRAGTSMKPPCAP